MREATRLSMIVSMPDAGGASTASRAWLFGTYGHLVDANLWQAARFVGAPGASAPSERGVRTDDGPEVGTKTFRIWAFWMEPPSESNR